MKRLAVMAALMTAAIGVYAQGKVVFANNDAGVPVKAPVYGVEALRQSGNSSAGLPVGTTVYTAAGLVGAGYTAELWGGSTSDPLTFQKATSNGSTTFRTSGGSAAGIIINPAGDATFSNITPGTTGYFQMRVWDNKGGTITSWAAALANPTVATGYSDVFSVAGVGGPDPLGGPDIPTPKLAGLRSFNLTVVPEPATIAMLALGLGGLLMVRRRN